MLAVQQSLLERDAELEGIEGALDRAASGEGSLLQVEGAAGIGKTSLLDVGGELARERGFRVLAARGGELERDFAYGVVRRLFERELGEMPDTERADVLSASAAFAGPAVGFETDAEATGPDATFAVVHGLYWLTANLAARERLVLVVDDLHWADQASLRYLIYLAARVEELPVVLLSAARRGEPAAESALVDQLAAIRGAELVRPSSLTIGATGHVLADRLDADADRAFVKACHTATRGNPFLLHELVNVLRADGAGAREHDAATILDLGPDTVSRSLMLRLARMPAPAAALASSIAVLGNDAEPEHAAALADVDAARAMDALDALVAAEIVTPERPLNFVHPMVRSAIYSDLGPGERSTMHGRAAELLAASGATAERIAPHLLHSAPGGQASFVTPLREAARTALARGAPDAAVRYLRRALEETPGASGDGELLCELGTAEYTAGEEPETALEHLRAGIPLIDDPARRVDGWHALSLTTMAYFDLPTAVEVLERALDDLGHLDVETRTRLEIELTTFAITHADSFEHAASRIDARSEVEGRTVAERLALCNFAYLAGMRGTSLERTAQLCERAFAGGELMAAAGAEANAVDQAIYVLLFADGYELALEQVEIALAHARASGSVWAHAGGLGVRGGVRWFMGDMLACEADTREALELPGSPPFAAPFISTFLALALIERGDLGGAEAAIERGGCGPELPPIVHMDPLFWARARLRLAQGRGQEALDDLTEYGARSDRVGAHNPGIPWRADAALACTVIGDHERAREFASQHLRAARTWGANSVVGNALRAYGLVVGGTEGIELLHEAVDTLARSPARLLHAHALIDLGGAMRRSGRRQDARPLLREGLEAARRCGATALVERAHAELVTAGARPRRLMFSGVESLTASERRVATMASDGMSNREIAQALFVTVKTVENHLSRAYGKLDIHSREELPAALAEDHE